MELNEKKIEQIHEIMKNHKGIKNPLASKALAKLIGIKPGSANVNIRNYILATMRKYNVPYGAAGNKGYYIIQNREELESIIRTLNNRIHNISARVALINKCYYKYFKGTDLELSGEEFSPLDFEFEEEEEEEEEEEDR